MSSETKHIKQPQSLLSRKYLIISITLSLATMAGVIYWTYTPGVLEHLAPKRLPGLVIAIVVSLLRVWFAAAKIRFLSEKKLNWFASVRVVLAWDFTSAVTPSTIGGAPMATYAMTKEGLKLGDAGAIILYGVLLDQLWFAMAIPILLFAGIFYEVVPAEVGLVGDVSMGLLYVGLLSYASVLAYGVLRNPAAIKKVVKVVFKLPVLRKMSDKIEIEAENLEQYAHQLRKKPFSFLMKAFFLSTMSWIMRIALPTIVVLSLLPAPEVLSVLRSLAMNLAFLVVPTPGGSGGVEGLFVLFQGPLISREGFIGLAVFLWRIISYYISVGLGIMATTWYINQKVVEVTQQD
ncbi:MAG: flippase-like domain-containing protein [Gracilimonas sp.]|uniref:lysylphosphatidylglycerol synthase transmembrane domain-containing protein n=1 Tax=Gracilimonas sp. TaxID=1974203 RepID=UPI003752DA33|nr:flippase-like domain-containing protein [Gracilimonas sp.]